MEKSAIFSPDRKYRYDLCRIWKENKNSICFVCLNPSTADENIDDPTVRRCIRYADSWGYGGIYMLNLFAFRSTDPSNLYTEKFPIGDENDKHIRFVSEMCDMTILAWGNHGKYMDRSSAVLSIVARPYYLKLTNSGEPGHPLYLKKDLRPIEWEESK